MLISAAPAIVFNKQLQRGLFNIDSIQFYNSVNDEMYVLEFCKNGKIEFFSNEPMLDKSVC